MKNRQIKLASTILVAVTVAALAGWRFWGRIHRKPASESLHSNVKALVEKDPELRPSYDRAMEDGVLTLAEARAILDEADTKKGSP